MENPLLAINTLIIIYVSVSIFFIATSTVKHKQRHLFLAINIALLSIEILPFFDKNLLHSYRLVYDWLPLAFLPFLHRETELLTTAYGRPTYDNFLIDFDKRYFPSVMAMHANNYGNSKILSEFLHFCYLSFYLLIYGVPLYFYLKQDNAAFYQSLFIIFFLLFSCYLTHGIIPASGPRNIFDKINDKRSEGFFFRSVHKILASGSTHGTAFPSGHTGVASVVLLITWQLHTPLFYWVLPLSLGLIVSTIYGRFHYVLDAIAGFTYALIAFYITLLLFQ